MDVHLLLEQSLACSLGDENQIYSCADLALLGTSTSMLAEILSQKN